MCNIIAITSGKGGVGKTTFCVNLGWALSKSNKKVLIMDGDIGLNNLDVVLGVENKIVYDIIDVIEYKCRPKQALIEDFNNPNFFVLPSNHTYTNFNIEAFHIKSVLESLKDDFDYILIDCPAGVDDSLKRVIEVCDSAIVITTPHISAVRDADKTISIIQNYGITNVNIVVNKVRGDLILSGNMIKIESINEYLDCELLGVIPESDDVASQLLIGGACLKGSEVYNAFKIISRNLENENKIILDCTKKYKGIIGGLRRNLKRIV